MSLYKSIHKYGRDEIIINKSRFICSVLPISSEEEAIDFIEKIKKEFKEATHNVYAYVIGQNSNVQRFTDDGEPSGTAGMPVLNVINQENLKNVVVVVTRYFGGVLLGAGGLARAYSKSAKTGLEKGLIVDKSLYHEISATIEYTMLGKIENELTKNNFIIKDKKYGENVDILVLVRDEEIERLNNLFNEVTSGKAQLIIGQSSYYSIKDEKIVE
ncbi:putative YigZ family protein [Sedimentibacter acidaminivorans]|uniref:YigZ family protein n=1 Tax=Sedimentibacter acidaminivorans TaxID=913099 RepID=A0ABS4GHB9_9FIRM|nr:YigZ family protein [Sedimentibacter acidaminivorans]MBP1927096.1 putative YigZ family protein [Sedimentibacter acidaminivorans]